MTMALGFELVMDELKILVTQERAGYRAMRMVSDYAAPNASENAARVILSDTDRVTWFAWQKEQR